VTAGRWFITPHAVRRYIERISPGSTYEQALAFLIDQSETAHPTGWVAADVLQYRAPRPLRLRYRVRHGQDGGLPQLLTVLPEHDRWITC